MKNSQIKKDKNQHIDTYWGKFLQTGKIEDYLNYKRHNQKSSEDFSVEIAKIEEINGDINEQKNKKKRGSSKGE